MAGAVRAETTRARHRAAGGPQRQIWVEGPPASLLLLLHCPAVEPARAAVVPAAAPHSPLPLLRLRRRHRSRARDQRWWRWWCREAAVEGSDRFQVDPGQQGRRRRQHPGRTSSRRTRLSFLPAHEAVPTCALARRWRHLWRSAPSLRVTGVKDCANPEWFVAFVDNLLLLRHPSARLDSFELDLDGRDFDFRAFLPGCDTQVNLWFRHAVLCGACALALRTTRGVYRCEDDDEPLGLPNVPLISRHLKKLDLQLVYLRSSTLDFSGCPALVDLRMKECVIAGNISSPFLKHLSIICCYFQMGPSCARICLPCLVSLELTDVMRRGVPMLESMLLLVSAILRLSDFSDACRKNDYGDGDDRYCYGGYNSEGGADDSQRGKSVLLKGLSEVADLEFSDYSEVCVNRDFELWPTFSKLKTLLLSDWCPGIAGDLSVLTCFLQQSPILEKLTLQLSKVPKDPVETEGCYCLPEQLSTSSNLKIVEIKCEEVDARVHQMLNIMSIYGIPIEVDVKRTN